MSTRKERHEAGWVHTQLCKRRAVIGFAVLVAMCAYLFAGQQSSIDQNRTTAQAAKSAVDSIATDRTARIAARCGQDHDTYEALQTIVDLLNNLLHQTDPNDPRITDDQRSLFLEAMAKADASLAETRARLGSIDCTTPALP